MPRPREHLRIEQQLNGTYRLLLITNYGRHGRVLKVFRTKQEADRAKAAMTPKRRIEPMGDSWQL